MMQIFIDFFLSIYKFINERSLTAVFFGFQILLDIHALTLFAHKTNWAGHVTCPINV